MKLFNKEQFTNQNNIKEINGKTRPMSSGTSGWVREGSLRSVSSAGDGNGGSGVASYMDQKPREEKSYQEFYPDLDVNESFKVFPVNVPRQKRSIPRKDVYPHKRGASEPKQNSEKKELSLIHKSLISLGYKASNEVCNVKIKDVYIRPDLVSNAFANNTLTRNDKFRVMYDMDEQDAQFIDILNHRYDLTIPYEVLEIAFTFLEREWLLLERIIPPKRRANTSMNSAEMIDKASQHTSIYGSDDGTGGKPELDQPCAVCNESECDNSNAIVFCDGCDIAVHQECYGVVFIPEGQWLCRRCLISRNSKSPCLFCPSTTGAFKQTDTGAWSHVICALWINELYFANPIYMEPVEGVEAIPKGRWRLVCYICRQRMGACIQCSNRNCFQLYHVTCARRSELYMQAKNGVQLALTHPADLVSYCDRHAPASYDLLHDTRTGIERTRLYFATVGAIKKTHSDPTQLISVGSKSKNQSPFKWKSDYDTPIAPEMFAERLYRFLKTHNLQLAKDLIYRVCLYWSLKREHKRGAPLIKRLDATQYGALNSQEIEERIQFLDALREDVDKMYELTDLTERRAKINDQITHFKLTSLELVYFPINYIIGQLMSRIEKLMDGNKRGLRMVETGADCPSFHDILEKIDTYQYSSVSEFIRDFNSLIDRVFTLSTGPALAVKRGYTRSKKELSLKFKSAISLESEILTMMKNEQELDLATVLTNDVFDINGLLVDLQRWEGPDVAGDLTDLEDIQ